MRIGINVPNDLLNRVKAIRPEVNVSQICRDALEERAHKAERVVAQVASDGMEECIQRFAFSSKAPSIEPDWVAYALKDARDWTMSVTPEEWEFFCYQRDTLVRLGRGNENWHAELSHRDDVKSFTVRARENEEWFICQYEIDVDSNVRELARDEYCRTWMAYAEEVRRLVEERRREKSDNVLAERKERMRELGKPELPPQLLD